MNSQSIRRVIELSQGKLLHGTCSDRFFSTINLFCKNEILQGRPRNMYEEARIKPSKFSIRTFPMFERRMHRKYDNRYSSSTGISSSIYLIKDILISVVSFPRRMSLIKCASTCICTISRAPLSIPQNIFENHNSSCALPSSGNSTKSARGFSSNIKENCFPSLVQFVTVGVILRKILNPTSNTISGPSHLGIGHEP